jgi:heat shock protein beta-11
LLRGPDWSKAEIMTDYGLATSGTEIAFSSCVDERHPPENILDGTDRTFWVTTGLFPQQVCFCLENLMNEAGRNANRWC